MKQTHTGQQQQWKGRRAILAKAHGRDKSLPKYAPSHHDRTIGAPGFNQDPGIEGSGVLRPGHHDRTIGAPGFNQDPEIEGKAYANGGVASKQGGCKQREVIKNENSVWS